VLLVATAELFISLSSQFTSTGTSSTRAFGAGADAVPAASLHAARSVITFRTVRHAPLAPALSSPVEPTNAFREPHLLASGDTLGALAERYGVSLESLIWANGLERGDALMVGQWLRIPRVSGVPYIVRPGDNVEQIAALHQVSPEILVDFSPNRLSEGVALRPGVELFVPGVAPALPDGLLEWSGGRSGLARRGPVVAALVREQETNLRQGPGTEYPRVARLDAGRQVELRGRHKEWVKAALAGVEGWIRADLLAVAPAVVTALPETRDFPPPPPRWIWPARGTLTSGFGPRWGSFHNGLDIANRVWTPISAASAGRVREAGWCRGYGYCVKIRHSAGVETVYGHMVDQPVVSAGEEVTAGQLIGYMGSTYDRAGGGYSTGVHLHFTLLVNGRAVDPLRFLP